MRLQIPGFRIDESRGGEGMIAACAGDRRHRLRNILICAAALLGLLAEAATAIDDSVYTEINAFGLIDETQYKKIKARQDVVVIPIKDGRVGKPEVHVNTRTVVVFENQDKREEHFLYIEPDENNDLNAKALTEMIGPGVRWAATFTSGEYPFRCARHPDRKAESGRIFVTP
jgi:hypothetical protein